MNPLESAEVHPLPKVKLDRGQWLRLALVGLLAAFSLARVLPDTIRIVQPLGLFNYTTDGDGVVVGVPPKTLKGADEIKLGDRVRIDRIKPFDRKPGLARGGFTYDNPDRHLPVERAGRVRILHLIAHDEPATTRGTSLLRILIYFASVFLGGLLFLMKPGLPTAAFFVFCLGGEYPSTYAELYLDVPWREIPSWIGDTLRGAAAPALLLFAFCLLEEAPERRRVAAAGCALLAIALGTLHAFGNWRLTYAGQPAQRFDSVYGDLTALVTGMAVVVIGLAFWRARGVERTRTAIILAAFAFAGLARILSVELYPGHIPAWVNALLQTAPIVPIVIVWIAVVRHSFFDVDFVVSRGVVFVALTGALLGFAFIFEELAGYLFYNNVENVAYIVLSAVLFGFGVVFSRISKILHAIVDRFIFRGRHNQAVALDLIAGYILDAESAEDVYRALLEDAPHALQLSFGGIFTRRARGDFEMTESRNWPADCDVRMSADDELVRTINRSRSVLTQFSAKDSAMIRRMSPAGRLTFAAPIFTERKVGAIVVYGQNLSGLDLDPDEREGLVRVVEHASIALHDIELARYRALVERLTQAAAGRTSAGDLSVPRPDSG
jgi:hypothetical protein